LAREAEQQKSGEFIESTRLNLVFSLSGCDEYIESYGGRIILDGQKHLLNTYIDCVWVIARFPAILRNFDRIYLKVERRGLQQHEHANEFEVEEFHIRGTGLRLEVRKGSNSMSERVLMLFDEQTTKQLSAKQPAEGFVTQQSSPAFYIRLRGYLSFK